MQSINPSLPVTEVKNRLLQLIREIEETDEVLTITRGGVAVAVMLSPDRYRGLLETIEVLADSRTMTSLRRSTEEGQAGRWITDETEVFGQEEA